MKYGTNSILGWNSADIADNVHFWVCSKYCESIKASAQDNDGCDFEAPNIDLVGHSRGGVIAVELAWKLKEEGCTCTYKTDVTHKPVQVRFVGTYDAVDMAVGLGNYEDQDGRKSMIPSNVRYSAVAIAERFPNGAQSRGSWRRPKYTNATWRFINPGTHSAFGGAPTFSGQGEIDGYSARLEIATSIAVDTFIRSKASGVGVPIGAVSDYDFDNLPLVEE